MSASFAQTMLDAARPHEMAESAFVQHVMAGACDRATLRRYCTTLYGMASRFPQNLSAVLSVCTDWTMRRFIMRNLAEEEGLVAYARGEATFDDARHHTTLATRFARAAGASDEDLATVNIEPSRWFRTTLESGNWIGPTAFFSVGVEANVPRTFRLLIEPLERHYGFSRDALAFLIEHMDADERHGVDAAELIATLATTPEMREQALEGARRGGMSWWTFHRLAA